jgi:hypothetical protein
MDILIQSLLDKVRKFNVSMHIRYATRPTAERTSAEPQPQRVSSDAAGGQVGMTSYVIIHREYSYLEPLIRSIFDEAEDVKVLIDRRSEERAELAVPPAQFENRNSTDRRASTPMLDILINVES